MAERQTETGMGSREAVVQRNTEGEGRGQGPDLQGVLQAETACHHEHEHAASTTFSPGESSPVIQIITNSNLAHRAIGGVPEGPEDPVELAAMTNPPRAQLKQAGKGKGGSRHPASGYAAAGEDLTEVLSEEEEEASGSDMLSQPIRRAGKTNYIQPTNYSNLQSPFHGQLVSTLCKRVHPLAVT
ncbi:hypothetical protein CEUSTIGMA_g5550.t1 [Chlamydomonas eustigma]|uniref:Uncharacterized protein n=1 Tax=Chlamydomonas eustigma TaxID=1157962 RepID=A0A250X4V9_9CHLO|nr:hypothetical protein CEUSTIGMA_g5550.t1 [Chlamydomonas eustigma]|eukprot:GAX78108.1 hypothetical protein CEUSTIGMA_g5550.t1 [Chlamydomonas eustigma]